MSARTKVSLDVDYLVIGAGATGLAFVDTLLSSNPRATIAIVDKYTRPGGHWTTAYSFVRLHQPSMFYGVNSAHLGQDKVDQVGLNKGLFELATVDEICAYYANLMQNTFLPTSRVQYFPRSEWNGDRQFHSILTGQEYEIGEKTVVVDSTYVRVMVPSMRPTPFPVESGLDFVPLNDMTKLSRPFKKHIVIGAGKTGMDACIWLLTMGINPDQVTWVVPRDSWILNRKLFDDCFVRNDPNANQARLQAVLQATSSDDIFHRMVDIGYAMRLDETVTPSKYRCATLSTQEFEQLRRIKDVVRLGRVQSIKAGEMILEHGSFAFEDNTVFIDCMGEGEDGVPTIPIFTPRKITLQSVRVCQPVFSAGFIAHVGAEYAGDIFKKNKLCQPLPNPDYPIDQVKIMLKGNQNALEWNLEPKILGWLAKSRLSWPDPIDALNVEGERKRELAGKEVRGLFNTINDKLQELLRRHEEEERKKALD